ncbi:50S ribosomal protein L10 [Petrotoga sp. 9PWA.NaAc.5.4]|uniref:50S ribosomal protein L10 n=1 Tax=Petrotoga sp. 9PWA.NaAc.5.4 TaxID=1434328 RepID=UPI000CC4E0D9|nr:50S ribosomal protein L10 [Petrotoga sp. 9PWA.NaAc.5.4]PNR95947.1 50S ribosomal protein L10 [Petrotoga sp. 9PWA.NaAc.5.4]
MLTKEKKKSLIDEFIQALQNSPIILFVDFTGMSVDQTNAFRIELFKNFGKDVTFKVYRTSLLKTASKLASMEKDYQKFFEGSTGVIYAKDRDPIEVLKVVQKFSDSNNQLPQIKGGILEGAIIDAEKVKEYSKLPSKQELYAMLARSLNSPISGLVNVLSGTLRSFLYVLNAIKENK